MPYRDGARRRLRTRAVLGPPPAVPPPAAGPVRSVQGIVVDASPHVLVLDTGDDEPARLPMTAATSIWHGGRSGLPALVPGRHAVVRCTPDGRVAERIWVDIMRVTGTIVACTERSVEVDGGPHRGPAHVTIPPNALGRILVRHPRMEPGYLVDVICVRTPDGPHAVRPGTSQPSHPADRVTSPPPEPPGSPSVVEGTATWFGDLVPPWEPPSPAWPPSTVMPAPLTPSPASRRIPPGPSRPAVAAGSPFSEAHPSEGRRWRLCGDLRGAAYPAVDPVGHAGGCADAPEGCARLPYLSCGSELIVHNRCSDRTVRVPVTECGCVAVRYCDRCVECGTSPRGRVVELTPLSFVELGGDLDAGCFNVTLGLAATAASPGPATEGRP